jgi:hypothetical protein
VLLSGDRNTYLCLWLVLLFQSLRVRPCPPACQERGERESAIQREQTEASALISLMGLLQQHGHDKTDCRKQQKL